MAIRISDSSCPIRGQRLYRRNQKYKPRDSLPDDDADGNGAGLTPDYICVGGHYKVKVIEERHRLKRRKGVQWHCHLRVTDPGNTILKRGGRANLLFILDPHAEDPADRVLFIFHNSRPGLVPISPYDWSRTARKRVYQAVVEKLGSREPGELRWIPSKERAYSLLNGYSYSDGSREAYPRFQK